MISVLLLRKHLSRSVEGHLGVRSPSPQASNPRGLCGPSPSTQRLSLGDWAPGQPIQGMCVCGGAGREVGTLPHPGPMCPSFATSVLILSLLDSPAGVDDFLDRVRPHSFEFHTLLSSKPALPALLYCPRSPAGQTGQAPPPVPTLFLCPLCAQLPVTLI